mgnify:CR=1 FL=1
MLPACDDDRALTTAVNNDSKCFTAALDKKKYSKNADKAEIALFGRRTVTYRIGKSGHVIGRVLPKIMLLGAYVTGNGSNGAEIDRIISSINKGWCMVGQFWTSGAECTIKRIVFMGIVVGAAVSGAETFVIGPNHAKRMDT